MRFKRLPYPWRGVQISINYALENEISLYKTNYTERELSYTRHLQTHKCVYILTRAWCIKEKLNDMVLHCSIFHVFFNCCLIYHKISFGYYQFQFKSFLVNKNTIIVIMSVIELSTFNHFGIITD